MELDNQYSEIFIQAVNEIRTARNTIARQINTVAMGVYWNLGKLLSEKKIEKKHGDGVVKQLSVDLKLEFPDMGLSPRNLWDMKRFYERYASADPKLRQAVAVLLWGHNLLLLDKVNNANEALFYAEKAITLGWSRNILLNYLKADTYQSEKTYLNPIIFRKHCPKYWRIKPMRCSKVVIIWAF